MLDAVFTVLGFDFFGLGTMSSEVFFGLKIIALVMLYGYMHMNLGGGLLSTAVFLVFAYYFVFVADGVLAIMVLVIFFVMIHGFDLIWGGDIVKGNVSQIMAERQAARGAMMHDMHYYHNRMPP